MKRYYAAADPVEATAGCKGIVRVQHDTYGDDCCGPSTDVYIECPLCLFRVGWWEGDLTFHVMTEAQMMHNRLAKVDGAPSPAPAGPTTG